MVQEALTRIDNLTERLQTSDILVIGGAGYIGTSITKELEGANISAYWPTSREIDITNRDLVKGVIERFRGRTVVLAAAMTDVKRMEVDGDYYQKAVEVNCRGAQNVADYCASKGKQLIFFGTGYERSGSQEHPGPYTEDAPLADEVEEIKLLGKYARTKLMGDRLARRAYEYRFKNGLAIIYVDYPCGAVPGVEPRFVRPWYLQTLLKNQADGKPAFNDQQLTITDVKSLAKAVRLIAKGGLTGVFNIAAEGVTTPYFLLKDMMSKLGEDPLEVRVSSIRQYALSLQQKGQQLVWPISGGLDCRASLLRLRREDENFILPSWRQVVDENLDIPGGLREYWESIKGKK